MTTPTAKTSYSHRSRAYTRTARSSWKDREGDATVMQLVHGVKPDLGEWVSICGYGFLSYETQWEPRPITCVWCLAGLERNERRRGT